MQARETARTSLIPFTEYTNDLYVPARHHRLIAEKLEAVARGEIDRLMIFMPPRHGKSELASRRFPAWYLGRNPRKQVIAASYNSDLAGDFGRDVRNIVGSPQFRVLFPDVSLAADSAAANRWHTNKGGAYVAAGVGTAVTGRGADILLIDDPLKDREEADSEVIRDRVWNWYTSTAYTRLMPGGAVIVIQTRWHEDDLAGRLLAAQAQGGDKWDVLELPAINAAGEPLWPEWYDLPALERIRGAIGPRDWSALYQQAPAPDDGDFFKREWMRFYDEAPKHLRVYGASDYAVTADGGDWTVHGVCGVDPDDNLYVLDWWRAQTTSDVWIEELLRLGKQWKPVEWAEEQGQINKSVGPFIEKRQRETQTYFYRKQFASAVDKATRAQSIRARMAMGKVYFPRTAPWSEDLIGELLRFPVGKHDDQVDVMSLFGRMLAEMMAAATPKSTHPNASNPLAFNNLLAEARRRRLEREE